MEAILSQNTYDFKNLKVLNLKVANQLENLKVLNLKVLNKMVELSGKVDCLVFLLE